MENTEVKQILWNSFYKASITSDTQNKLEPNKCNQSENYRPVSNISNEERSKNSHQHLNKSYPTEYQKDHSPWFLRIYSKDKW